MKREFQYFNTLSFCVVLLALAFSATAVAAPLKVFILAGQSNMVGHGEITTGDQGNLRYMVDNDTNDTFAHLVDNDDNWVVRDDVWVWWNSAGHDHSVGLGNSSNQIGPELEFGNVLGDAYDEQVLLIKTAWGGKSLAVDFRPPSSGGTLGPYYTEMLSIVNDVLDNLPARFPEYAGQGYELVGFGWHQGWNDRVDQAHNDEYEVNMANFIRDVRSDLGIPALPFVIATTGMSGWDEDHPRALSLMEAQLAMADTNTYPEFAGNVAVVETRDFWRAIEDSPADQSYHWNRNAESYFLIGQAMGEEMATLTNAGAGTTPGARIAPSSAYAVAGNAFTLTAPGAGSKATGPYQWYKNGEAIDGADTGTLTFASLAEEDAGTYSVTYQDGSKAEATAYYDLVVYPAGTTVPFTSLAPLAGACILIGASILARKK